MDSKLKNLQRIANQLFKEKKWAELIPISTEIIRLKPLVEMKAIAYQRRGISYAEQGEYNKAIADFSQAIALNHDNADIYYNRGTSYARQGEYNKAIADFSQAIDLNPDSANAYHNRGDSYAEQGKHEKAIVDYDQEITLNPKDENAYYSRGNSYSEQGKYDKAIADFSQAITLNPDSTSAYNDRAILYAKQGEYDKAIADFSQAIALNPDGANTHFNRGHLYAKQGEYEKAKADYDQEIILNPEDENAYYSRGDAYSEQGKHDKAIADFSQAIALNPKHSDVYDNRGISYLRQREFDKAIADFSQEIILNPKYSGAYINRGISYVIQGEDDKAIADYTQAIVLNPKNMVAYYNRSLVYTKQGAHKLAFADYLAIDSRGSNLKLKSPRAYIATQMKSIFPAKGNKAVEAFELYSIFFDAMFNIKKHLFYEPKNNKEVAHYTSLHTFKHLAKKEHFRLYNSAYMNDPEEGQIFFEIMERCGVKLEEDFYENKEELHLSPAYIGSFIQVDLSPQDKDKLFLWRTYGKHDNKEATGVCLIFKHEKGGCFTETMPQQIGAMLQAQRRVDLQPQTDAKTPLQESDRKISTVPEQVHPALYEIVYKSETEKGELHKKLVKLADSLKKIKEFYKGKNKQERQRLSKLVRELLDEIRFLFKADHYKEEKEIRIIQVRYTQENEEQNEVKVNAEQIPPRFYLETPESCAFSEVILGPETQNKLEWKQWIKEQDNDLTVTNSKIKYRNQ